MFQADVKGYPWVALEQVRAPITEIGLCLPDEALFQYFSALKLSFSASLSCVAVFRKSKKMFAL